MGNHLVFGDRTKYVELEAGLGTALLGLTIIGIVTFFFIYFCCCFKLKDCLANCKEQMKKCLENSGGCCCCCCCYTNNTTSDCSCNAQVCKKFFTSTKQFHRILGYVFSSISELHIKTDNNADAETAPVFIISERTVPPGFTECLTYFYFTYMLLMCGLWFFTMLVELSIYRKTGTCNDINVEVRSFSCFDVDNNFEIIDCEQTPNIDTRRVICYLYSPTIAGVGVAFSIAKLISVLGYIAYDLILKGTNRCPECFCFVRIIGLLLMVAVFIVFMVVAHVNRIYDTNYFTYGGIPMRWTQLLLILMTGLGILLFPPWTKYSDNDYITKYRHLGYKDVEKAAPQPESTDMILQRSKSAPPSLVSATFLHTINVHVHWYIKISFMLKFNNVVLLEKTVKRYHGLK